MDQGTVPAARPVFEAADIGALAHLYRGELYRSTVWRTRLDATTNWAVGGVDAGPRRGRRRWIALGVPHGPARGHQRADEGLALGGGASAGSLSRQSRPRTTK